MKTEIDYVLLDEKCEPKRMTEGAAGFDLITTKSMHTYNSPAVRIPLGVKFSMPLGTFGMLVLRSSVWSLSIPAGIGIIDSDYRGEVHVQILSMSPREIEKYARICQIVFVPNNVTLNRVDKLSDTTRGAGGFGSTGG